MACADASSARPRDCWDCWGAYGPDGVDPYGGFPYGDGYDRLPFGWDDREGPPSSDNPSYPQGFVLTYTVRHKDAEPAAAGPIRRYAEVGRALAACWAASSVSTLDWRQVTLRFSFKRDGSLNGTPVVKFLDAPGDASALAKLRTTILAALGQCTPLRFSNTLGGAIAGQIFSIRFIQAKDT